MKPLSSLGFGRNKTKKTHAETHACRKERQTNPYVRCHESKSLLSLNVTKQPRIDQSSCQQDPRPDVSESALTWKSSNNEEYRQLVFSQTCSRFSWKALEQLATFVGRAAKLNRERCFAHLPVCVFKHPVSCHFCLGLLVPELTWGSDDVVFSEYSVRSITALDS